MFEMFIILIIHNSTKYQIPGTITYYLLDATVKPIHQTLVVPFKDARDCSKRPGSAPVNLLNTLSCSNKINVGTPVILVMKFHGVLVFAFCMFDNVSMY